MSELDLTARFVEAFGDATGVRRFFSPGRINLIGEHTDYNGGYVFPAAITIGTTGLARARDDRKLRLYSVNFPDEGVVEADLSDLTKKSASWTNYVKGMLTALKGAGYALTAGFDLLVSGEIPTASGLSSSASLELLVGVVADGLFGLDVPRLDLVKLGMKTENDYIGVNSGIMDQFAVGFGQAEHAILLDCNTLDYELVPVKLGAHAIVIMNTNKPRALTESKYNERFAETREALKRLQDGGLKISALGELSNADFDAAAHLIGDATLVKRARHAVYENNRCKEAEKALSAGDLTDFGRLLNASHASLKDDYAVTGLELDTLAETAQRQPGVLGARMTGAGFGGCAIALVETDAIEAVTAAVGAEYQRVVGYDASFYVAQLGDGAREI